MLATTCITMISTLISLDLLISSVVGTVILMVVGYPKYAHYKDPGNDTPS